MRCYGYELDGVTVIEPEAEVLREIAQRILNDDGESLRQIVADLDDRGLKTSTGSRWSPKAIVRLMTNPRLSGMQTYKGEIVGRGSWPPILDWEQQERVIAKLRDPARRTNKASSTSRVYLLTGGKSRCGLCGNSLSAQRSNSGRPGMICRKGEVVVPATGSTPAVLGCGRIRIAAEPLERDVAEHVLARFASRPVRRRLAEQMGPEVAAELRGQIAELERRQVEAGEDYGRGLITRESFVAAQQAGKRQLAELRERLARCEQLETLEDEITAGSLARWWESASVDRRRQLVDVVLDHVTVGPATRPGFTGFDAARVSYSWI